MNSRLRGSACLVHPTCAIRGDPCRPRNPRRSLAANLSPAGDYSEGKQMRMANETYLGDGLYASYDGFMITLRAPREREDHWVGLEPQVWRALVEYVRVKTKTREPTNPPEGEDDVKEAANDHRVDRGDSSIC